MKIHTKVVYRFVGDRLVLVEDQWYEYAGPVDECKGASAPETNIANAQQSLGGTLQKDFGTAFQGQQGILSSLTGQLTNIFNAGPGQFGFSPGQTTAMNTAATNVVAQQYANARKAAGEASAAAGGGNQFLPTGAANQTQANIATAGAQAESNALNNIQLQGYNQGQRNFETALSGLNATASQYNPTAYSGQAGTINNSAFEMQNKVATENAAASPWNIVGGALGGIAGSFLGPIGASVGSTLGSKLSGALGGISSGASDGKLFGSPSELP